MRGLLTKLFGRNYLRARDLGGNVVVGDVHGIVIQTTVTGPPPAPLTIPWREPSLGSNALGIFNLLTWRSRLAPTLIGRDPDRVELLAWARDSRPISIRLLSGPGGVGKSRLAAEVADELRAENWSTGIISLDQATTLPVRENGVLIAVDYPERNRDLVRSLFREAGRLERPPCRIRILLVSRNPLYWWQEDLIATQASELCDAQDVALGDLSAPDTCRLVHAVRERLDTLRGVKSPILEDSAISEWHARKPTLHGLPLIATAAAVHAVIDPAPTFSLGGTEIIEALVVRERARIDAAAENADWPEAKAGSRLLGLAALRTSLDEKALKHLARKSPDIGLPPPDRIVDRVEALGWRSEGQIPAPQPDLLAAELLHQILKDHRDAAPNWLAAAIPDSKAIEIDRLGRLMHDITALHGDNASRLLVNLFSAAIERNPDQAEFWEGPLASHATTFRLAPIGITANRVLLKVSGIGDVGRAGLWHNLSVHLAKVGDRPAALEAIHQAVEIFRHLARDNPSRFEPDFAAALNNLSVRLAAVGEETAAMEPIRQAIEIRRRLAQENPTRFSAALATSLNNFSNRLADAGEAAAALEPIQQAVEIRRRLAQDNPPRFEPDLAQSLNNLSNRLADADEQAAALASIQQAVEIRRRLFQTNPARFEADLAMSLNNLSNCLARAGERVAALGPIQQAVEIRRRLVQANPALFEPDFATSLHNLSIRLAESGESIAALESIQQAVEIRRRLAQENPDRYEADFSKSLYVFSRRLAETGDEPAALAASTEASEILEKINLRTMRPPVD